MDNLARNAMLAKQAGMSYGKWKALHPTEPKKADEIPEGWRVCEYCGIAYKPKTKRRRRYCDSECQRMGYYNENKEKWAVKHREYARISRERAREKKKKQSA